MSISGKILLLVILIPLLTAVSKSDLCKDYLLLDGAEPLVNYGMDSTDHWWAVTSPFKDSYRLTVNGMETDVYKEIKNLIFSPDGEKWACFARSNTQWKIVSNDTVIDIPGTEVGDMLYSGNSEVLVYSYFEGSREVLIMGERTINIMNRQGYLYISYGAERFAFAGRRGNMTVLNINGYETPLFDEIKPIGFWYDGSFLYAARNGRMWEIYHRGESISEIFSSVPEVAINRFGTVAAVLAYRNSGHGIGLLISDEYYEPLVGRVYDWVGDLVLHPETEMIAYKARVSTATYVVLNVTEYYGGEETGPPSFTYNGNDLYFFGCNIDCFVNISGRKYPILTDISVGMKYAVKPGSETIAYSTNSSMIIRYLTRKELVAGMMVDQIIAPRYNWREDRYETLGSINDRLYLLTCKI